MGMILGKDGKPIAPSGYDEFRAVFNELTTGEREAESFPERQLKEIIDRAADIRNQCASPLEAVLVAWGTWISIADWISARMSPEGKKMIGSVVGMQTELAMQIMYDAWSAMEEIDGEEADPVPSEAPLHLI